MTSNILITLIGEQIIPNLLPIKYLKPEQVVAVYSDFTKKGYDRLKDILNQNKISIIPCKVDAYDIDNILFELGKARPQVTQPAEECLFNFTGGTKPMSTAAYLMAAKLKAPMIYFQTEGKQSRILRYEFRNGSSIKVGDEYLPTVINIQEYLEAHVKVNPPRQSSTNNAQMGHQFEILLKTTLSGMVDEIKPGANLQGIVDVDLILRCGNQVGIVEAKIGDNHIKNAIDQLNTAAAPAYLGTYTKKFLISDQDWSQKNKSDLLELAKAHKITVIELPGSTPGLTLSQEQVGLLRETIWKELGHPTQC